MLINLKKLISRKGTTELINEMVDSLGVKVTIRDVEGRILIGKGNKRVSEEYPIEVDEEIIGWIIGGGKKAPVLLSLITRLAHAEMEKRVLAKEALDKFKQINLLYNTAEKMSACLDMKEITRLVIHEFKQLIEGGEQMSVSIMLLDEKKNKLKVYSALGKEYKPKMLIEPGQGIAGNVFLTGRAEIINDVLSDKRYVKGAQNPGSMMCAPLKTKQRILGVMNISNERTITYKAGELDLLIILTTLAASAMENAILHESKLEEERIKSHLERYVPTQVVDGIVKNNISLEPVKSHISILFSDIRNFTSTCENLDAEKIVSNLNEYFTHMVDVIFDHGGTVNKFVGDMIVALFGAPTQLKDSEKRAIETAIKMQQCLKTMSNLWIRENFHTGIGINSGEMVVGNIGSPRHMDYTAIGDEVNIASRLQALAKPGQILVSKSIYEATKDDFKFKSLGFTKVKGKEKDVELFEVLYESYKKSDR